MRFAAPCSLIAVVLVASLSGCAPTKEGIKNRQAANDRMNVVSAQISYDQAKQLFATGQLDKALREIDKAIERFSTMGEYDLLRGRILLEQARLEQSLQSFTAALAKNPTLADAQYYAGVIYQRWSDDEQAYTCYSEAFRLAPDKVHYLLAAAESLVALGEFDEAQQLIEPKLAYFEHNAALRQLQAQIAMLKGDARHAADLYGEARLLNPDDLSLMEEAVWAQYAAAMYSQCYESAKALQEKLQHPPVSSEQYGDQGYSASADRSDLTHLEARCLAMMGRGVEARELYLKLTQTPNGNTTEPALWSELGTLCWELGDFRSLAQASSQLIAMAPERYEGYLFRAVNERHKGNIDEALRLFREACDRANGVALPFMMLGKALEQTGDVDGARLAYNQALQADPSSTEARTVLRRLDEGQVITEAPTDP